ncbi:MAG: AmmeMemoRadiSam system protein B [SAR324 cluster bacterium]|nr:AmmeMemoRadiSam system protein B [SAR324 cluster bacterium]
MFHRPMEFAGSWYPKATRACESQIRQFWESSPAPEVTGCFGVVPHAGWVFSGQLAARVFRALEDGAVQLVIVLGGHLGSGDPIVAMCEGQWETPFGSFHIHEGFRETLSTFPQLVLETESKHFPDNSTELQLPFAKHRFPQAELLPIRVPPGPVALELGRALAEYLARIGLRAVGVASTDLTHYGPNYNFEPKGDGEAALQWATEVNDAAFITAVESGDGEAVLAVARERHNACSAGAVAAMNELARAAGQSFHTIGHTTSAAQGPRDKRNFVGYLGGVYS